MPPRPGRGTHRPSGASSSARGRSRRRHSDAGAEAGGGAERWLVTYADMLTLLLVLFIVLFSISVVNTAKFVTLRSSLTQAFGSGQKSVLDGGSALNESSTDGTGQQEVMPGVPLSPTLGKGNTASSAPPATPATQVEPADYAAGAVKEVRQFKEIEQAINAALDRRGMHGAVQFAIDRRGLIITVVTNALVFPGNSAVLLDEGQRILAVITEPLRRQSNNIEVDGFTNQQNVSTDPYPSGWELSSARASAVVRYLIAGGVAPGRLSAVGFSDQRPLYPVSDPRSVTLNRRVEIVVLSALPAAAGDELQAAANR
jgi:chemotaxis protein MotB